MSEEQKPILLQPMTVRADKWLWATRCFKTRTLAAAACKKGLVEIDQKPVKSSRELKIGDVLTLKLENLTRRVQVLASISQRVAPKLVPESLMDLTDPAEYERQKQANLKARQAGPKPTTRERRALEKFLRKNDQVS